MSNNNLEKDLASEVGRDGTTNPNRFTAEEIRAMPEIFIAMFEAHGIKPEDIEKGRNGHPVYPRKIADAILDLKDGVERHKRGEPQVYTNVLRRMIGGETKVVGSSDPTLNDKWWRVVGVDGERDRVILDSTPATDPRGVRCESRSVVLDISVVPGRDVPFPLRLRMPHTASRDEWIAGGLYWMRSHVAGEWEVLPTGTFYEAGYAELLSGILSDLASAFACFAVHALASRSNHGHSSHKCQPRSS